MKMTLELPEVSVSIRLLYLGNVRLRNLVFLETILSQKYSVFHISQRRTEILLLMVLPSVMKIVTLLDGGVQLNTKIQT